MKILATRRDEKISKIDEGRHTHNPVDSPADQGEEDIGGSAPGVTSDDDVLDSVEEVTGEEPKPGETIADIVNKAEEERHQPPETENRDSNKTA